MDIPSAQPELKPRKFRFNKIIFFLLLGIFLVVSIVTTLVVLGVRLPFVEKTDKQEESVVLAVPEGWNIYKPKDFNYQVGYPKEWSWQELPADKDGVSRTIFGQGAEQLDLEGFSKIDSITNFVIILRIPTLFSLDNWLKEHLDSESQGTQLIVDGSKAHQINEPLNADVFLPSTTTFVKHKQENSLFIITVNILQSSEDIKDTYNKMLSNLNFTSKASKQNEKVNTSNWKTYQSSQFGYSIKVPDDWREIKEYVGSKIFRSYSAVKRDQGSIDEYGEIETRLNIIVQPPSGSDRDLWEELKTAKDGYELESDGIVGKKIKNLKLDNCNAVVLYAEKEIIVTYGASCVGKSKWVIINFEAETADIFEKNLVIYDAIISTFKFNNFKL